MVILQRGLLERGGMSPLSKARIKSPSSGNVQLRCTTPVSLSQLEAAYAVFQLPVPSYAAIAARQAQPGDQVDETQKSALHLASLQPNSAPATAEAATTAGAADDAQPESTSEPHKAQDHVAALIAEQTLGAVHGNSLGQSAELASGAAATAGEWRLVSSIWC